MSLPHSRISYGDLNIPRRLCLSKGHAEGPQCGHVCSRPIVTHEQPQNHH